MSLTGIKATIASNMGVEGLPLDAGLDSRASIIASSDCDAVGRLRKAGASIAGQASVDAAGFDVGGDGASPKWPDLAAGGSSYGISRHVALNEADLGLGIDTAGDVRVPAALAGLTSLVPGKSLLSTEGCVPVSFTLDRVGLVTRSVDEAFRGLAGLLGVKMDPATLPATIEGLKIGVPWQLVRANATPDIADRFEAVVDTLKQGGAVIRDAGLADLDLSDIVNAVRDTCATEAAEYHGHLLHEDDGGFAPDLAERLRTGMTLSDPARLKLATTITKASETLGEAMVTLDAIITPALPLLPRATDPYDPAINGFTALPSLTGTPALCMPTGTDAGHALQILGDNLAERKIVTIARWLERQAV